MSLQTNIIGFAVIGVLMTGTHVLTYKLGENADAVEHKAELDRITIASQAIVSAEQAKNRAQEQEHVQEMADLDAQHHKDMQNEIDSREHTIADLRAGTLRLRKQFTCPAATAAGAASQAGTGTGLGDGASSGGLQTADAEFLLREAGRADQVVVQLQACQDIVRKDRQ
jgi:hypothetical protein